MNEEFQAWFNHYVLGFMFSDIQREIWMAAEKQAGNHPIGGGNLLAALGLLCYTEVLGGLVRGTLAIKQGRKNFEAFLPYLGKQYVAFDEELKRESPYSPPEGVYHIYRCDVVHRFFARKPVAVSMLYDKIEPICGIGRLSGDELYFNVQKYFVDFQSGCARFHNQAVCNPNYVFPKELREINPS